MEVFRIVRTLAACLVFTAIGCRHVNLSQQIVGRWTGGTKEIPATTVFTKDGHFTYDAVADAFLQMHAEGTYSLVGDKLSYHTTSGYEQLKGRKRSDTDPMQRDTESVTIEGDVMTTTGTVNGKSYSTIMKRIK